MAETIHLICTVEELTDYATQATRTFAVNVSAGMDGNLVPATPLSQALLQPWLWDLQGVGLYCCTDLAQPKLNKPVTATLMANPPVEAAALTALKNRLSSEFAATLAASTKSPLFNWDPADPTGNASPVLADPAKPRSKQQHPWPNVLAHASTFPAPLPPALNLVFFFQTAATDLTGVVAMLVAPVFSVTVTDSTAKPPVTFTASYIRPAGTPEPSTPPPPERGYAWSYAPAVGDTTGCLIRVHQPGLTVAQNPAATAPTPGVLDPNSPWLLPQYEDGNEDWRATLELRVSENFDLARQILSVLRDPYPAGDAGVVPTPADIFGAAPTLDQLEQLRLTVLYLLRDTADFGLRYAPDGFHTLRYVIERVASSPTAQMPEDFDVDAFIVAAENALIAQEKSYLRVAPSGDWIDGKEDLASILGPNPLVLKKISPTPVSNQFPNPTFSSLLTALSDTQKIVAQDASIATLLFAQWDRVLGDAALHPETSKIWQTTAPGSAVSFSAQVQTELNTLAAASGLRKRMLLANLGGGDSNLTVWNAIVAIADPASADQLQIAGNLARVLLASFYSRFGIALPQVDQTTFGQATLPVLDFDKRIPSVAPPQPPLPPPVLDFLAQRLSAAALAAKSIVAADATAARPSPTAQPAVLRLHTTAQAATAKNDPLRGMAGVGMLLREFRPSAAPQLPWSCLNVAALDVLDPTQQPVEAEAVAFAPHRLSTRNGVQQTAISYDNRPLAAPSPATALSKYFSPDFDPVYSPLFRYRSIPMSPARSDSTQPESWARISGLKYGAAYQALGFLLRNSGALPKELADPNPARIAGRPLAPLVPVVPQAFSTPNLPIPTFTYKRRTPVGPLRIWVDDSKQQKDFNQQSLPLIPKTVAPLAREVYIRPKTATPGATLPLLMLWDSAKPEQTQKYAFTLRPPSTDINVWDRWVAGQTDASSFATTRAAVFTDFHLSTPKNLSDPSFNRTKNQPVPDVSMNDPAIVGYVCTLTPLYAPSTAIPGAPPNTPEFAPLAGLTPIAVAAFTKPGLGFAAVQGDQYSVTVAKAPPPDIDPVTQKPKPGPFAKLDITAGAITVTVPAGEVWQLSIAPAIDTADIPKFDANATNAQFPAPSAAPPAQTAANNPFELLIEYAQAASITPQDLWQSLKFDFPNDPQPSCVTLSVAPAAGLDWHLLRRVEVFRQVWRWMGRPLYADPPFTSAALDNLNTVNHGAHGVAPDPDTLGQALNWELQAFAERDDVLPMTESRVFFPPPPVPLPPVPLPTPTTQQIYSQDLSTDLRAHYFRFGVRAYSRYEGLASFQPFVGSVTRAQSIAARIDFTDPSSGGFTTQVRCFIPCRVSASAALPKPKILLVLPLTAPAPSTTVPGPSQQTSILVIADEPWYQIGGLAEQLTATIESVQLRRTTDTLQMLQFGPDPILTAPNPPIPEPAPGPPPALKQWVGTPIGTTFDEASTAPLLANTCFQFPLAQLVTTDGKPLAQSLDWYMAKLQFTRNIDPGMSLNSPAPSSQPTDGVWVQFLPSSAHFADATAKPIAVAQLTFKWPSNQKLKFILNSAEITLKPGPAAPAQPAPANLQLWALLMRTITDAAGQPGEAYVGLYNITTDTPPTNPIGTADRLYLLEIQNTPKTPPENTGWLDQLFPLPQINGTPADVTHRVVRMSDRIAAAPD